MGNFTSELTGLTANTTYYIRAYALNNAGIAYGEQEEFLKSNNNLQTSSFKDTRDGKIYKTVKIGNQTWMAENLAYLPWVSERGSNIYYNSHYYYVQLYNGTNVSEAKATDNYNKYGVLYSWEAAKSSCPPGWHLPTDDEWKQLEVAIGMTQSEADKTEWRGTGEGTKLKSNEWSNENTDIYGFSALPGNSTRGYTSNTFFKTYAFWWTATEFSEGNSWSRYISSHKDDNTTLIYRTHSYMSRGYSVRCVKD
jgi:uncharacterized protein (TIGR02145 family)